MSIEDGGPAFSSSFSGTQWESRDGDQSFNADFHGGMSLRDYFAGQALSGLCTKVVFVEGFKTHVSFDGPQGFGWASDDVAQRAYEVADAMLKARGVSS